MNKISYIINRNTIRRVMNDSDTDFLNYPYFLIMLINKQVPNKDNLIIDSYHQKKTHFFNDMIFNDSFEN